MDDEETNPQRAEHLLSHLKRKGEQIYELLDTVWLREMLRMQKS
jgi:hypothetical protein